MAVYVLLILRGVTVVARARRSFEMLLGCGVLTMLGIQTFMIPGYIDGLCSIPVTSDNIQVHMSTYNYGAFMLDEIRNL